MELVRIDTIVQFTQGSNSTWNNVDVPVPAGAVVIDTVNKIIKEGDGNTLFANLPVCLDYNFHASTSGAVTPLGDNVGAIAIADDSMYSPSAVKLTDVLNSIVAKETLAVSQQSRIDNLIAGNVVAEVSEGVIDGTIVICNNGKYMPGDKTLAQMISDLVASANTVSASMHIDDLVWYTDADLKHPVVTPNQLMERNTYWCKISGYHDTAELRAVDFGLATATADIRIISDKQEETSAMIFATYGGTNTEELTSAKAVDSKGNVFLVGATLSEGQGGISYGDCLIVKLDSNLNLIAKKIYGGTSDDRFIGVTVDKEDNVIAVGRSAEPAGFGGFGDLLIVKFNNDLNIIARKIYGNGNDQAFWEVATDSQLNIFVVGWSYVTGKMQDAVIVKFSKNLDIIKAKYYGGNSTEYFSGIVIDHNDNVFVCGMTLSEGSGGTAPYGDALIIKFDNNLNILGRKVYGGTGSDQVWDIDVDSQNNIFVVGYFTNLASTKYNGIIIKLSNTLSLIATKTYSNQAINNTNFSGVIVDKNDNVIVAGGADKGLILKFDNNLNLVTQRQISGIFFINVAIDSQNNILASGNTSTEGAGVSDFVCVKIPAGLPSGSFTGSSLVNFTYSEVTLIATSLNLTFADSALTLSDINDMTLANSTLTLAESNLSFERDVVVAARYVEPTKLITTIYSSADADKFTATTIDGNGDIIAVGSTVINGTTNPVIIKFNAEFTTLARKLYTGSYSGFFNSVITDASNNIICVGNYTTSAGGLNECFITKFDSTLSTVITHKTYGASGDDTFNDVVMDPSGNFIAVGYTTSEGSGLKDALVVKFNNNLSITSKKRYGGSGNDVLLSIAMDSVGNAICVGWTSSEGTNTSGLILKLDNNLNVVLRKYYNSSLGTTTEFYSVTVTTANVIYCAGRVIMASGNKGVIARLDSNLNTTANKLYGNDNGNTEFTGIGLDVSGNIFVVGKTNAEGAGNYDALAVKFDKNLVIKGRKTYGTVGMDADIDCSITSDGDVVISGYSVIDGSTDAMITKLPNSMPAGVYTNKYFTDLILSDSKLALSDDSATVINSSLTMADSALVLTNGSMIISNASGAIMTDRTVMDAVGNVFQVQIGNIVPPGGTKVSPVFNVVTNDGDNQVGKIISVDVATFGMITTIYGGTGEEEFHRQNTIDSSGNVICVGYTTSEGQGGVEYGDALIVKFDNSLNIIYKKIYGGTYNDRFLSVVTDASNNIYVCGSSASENAGTFDALIIKFSSSLSILSKKRLSGINVEEFINMCIDHSNNIYCVGHSNSPGGSGSWDALIAKFDSSLNLLNHKRYGGANTDMFYGVQSDSNNNVFAIGNTMSEGAGGTTYGDGLIVKFDPNLNILDKKIYGTTNDDRFLGVVVDSNDNVFVTGTSDIKTVDNILQTRPIVIKFDNDLNIIKMIEYYHPSSNINCAFIGINKNNNNDIFCVGYGRESTSTNLQALLVKFDNDLNIINQIVYGTVTGQLDKFNHVSVDSQNNIFCSGSTSAGFGGSTYGDGFVVKFGPELPVGTFAGNVIPELILSNINNVVGNASGALTNSNLTLFNGTLTLADTTLTYSDSSLSTKREVLSF
jgi:hypothetical protein